ncbi:pentatricopeptide repeat-containing protein At2g37230-like, partial [Macadamia integrifolia]|uniref:pentatricopeptide repeat-containing protein At2g37230-like n=1 Tax=Macadamia integrifolia TaxID=60698 RepID=UPI001C4FECDF
MATKLLSPWQSGVFFRISSRTSPFTFLRGFCSDDTSSVSEIPPIESQSPSTESDSAPNVDVKEENAIGGLEENIQRRIPRGKHPPKPEKLEDVICRMMANREWTTRLQRSIRELVPEFDHSLVWNVLHGARNSEHALQFFRWVVKTGYRHDRSTHLKMIQILGRTRKLNHARCILFDMPKMGVEWDEEFFIVLISSYGEAGIVQESVKMFRKMKELGVERTVKSYDALFKVIMRRGRYLMAKRVFNEMLAEGVMPIRHTYNVLLWGFFLSLKVETANRFFEDMKNRGISPDVVTYNTMIYGYIRVKKMEEAEKLFVEMKGKNLNPTVVSYTSMIKGYVSMGQVDDGLRLFDEMASFGIKPNHNTYSTLLPGLCDAEKMSEAHKLVEEMVETHQAPEDNSIFLGLISCQCKAGNLDWAADVLKGMIRLNLPVEAAHYGVLIESFCKAGAYQRAIKLLDKVIEKEIILNPSSSLEMEPSAYNPIIEYLCNNGWTVKAEVFLRHLMKKGVQDPAAFNNL